MPGNLDRLLWEAFTLARSAHPDGSIYGKALVGYSLSRRRFIDSTGQLFRSHEDKEWAIGSLHAASLASRGTSLEQELEDLIAELEDVGVCQYGRSSLEEELYERSWLD